MHVKSKCCCFVFVVVIVDDDVLMCSTLKEKLMHSEAVGGGCM